MRLFSVSGASLRIMSLHRSTQSRHTPPCTPRISFFTCSRVFPHSTQRPSTRSKPLDNLILLVCSIGHGDRRLPLPFFCDLVDYSIFERFLGRHKIVPIHIPANLVEWLPRVPRQDLVQAVMCAHHLLQTNL